MHPPREPLIRAAASFRLAEEGKRPHSDGRPERYRSLFFGKTFPTMLKASWASGSKLVRMPMTL